VTSHQGQQTGHEIMTDEQKKDDDDESEDSLSLSLGVLKLRLSGDHLGSFLPWIGWSVIILAIAYAVSLIMGSRSGNQHTDRVGRVISDGVLQHHCDDGVGRVSSGRVPRHAANQSALRWRHLPCSVVSSGRTWQQPGHDVCG
jgi:hypothetical protein